MFKGYFAVQNYNWTSQVYLSVISHLPIFNVNPHFTGTDATVERNNETRGGKGELYSETRVWNYDSISQWTKTSFLYCNRMNEAPQREAV